MRAVLVNHVGGHDDLRHFKTPDIRFSVSGVLNASVCKVAAGGRHFVWLLCKLFTSLMP